jgi:hypothetical protein
MPSPFPGMDPFIEGQVWRDFHTELITSVRAALMPVVIPRYVVRVEEYVYLTFLGEQHGNRIGPDTFLAERGGPSIPTDRARATTSSVTLEPITLTLPRFQEETQVYLTIRDRESQDVVTVIEILSPTNKNSSNDGHRQYLEKRAKVIRSPAHLVEIDLLRGGERLPTVEALPPADFYAFISRKPRRPSVDVFTWSLRDVLPNLPVPLANDETDAVLNLQEALTVAYDRAYYSYSLNYTAPAEPPLNDDDNAWAREILQAALAP